MKSINKNKPNTDNRYQPDQKQPHLLNPIDTEQFYISQEWADQIMEFHLNDEQPESIMAKRKLEQFSVQLNEQTTINSFKRNQNSINMAKNTKKYQQRTVGQGWTEGELTTCQNPKIDEKSKHKRSQSASHCKIRQTLKINTKNPNKFSFSTLSSEQRQLNLSFNNLSPFHMDTIHQVELSKELAKKVKSYSSRRPMTANYGASQKILTISDNTKSQKKVKNNETFRIHSINEVDPKTTSLKDNRFLKTFSFNSMSKSLSRSKRGSKNLPTNPQNETIQPYSSTQTQQKPHTSCKNRSNYARMHSETVEKNCYKQNKETYEPFSQRRYVVMDQKRHILNKKIKSYKNIMLSSHQCEKYYNNKLSKDQDNKKAAQQKMKTESSRYQYPSKVQPTYNSVPKPDPTHSPSKQSQIPNNVASNLQQDFSLLISMLKHQSQNIFGGQLHDYLTQVKNNSLYNYYCSGGYSKKKNRKLVLNTTGKLNKTQKGLEGVNEHDRIRGLIENQHVTKNNTTLHYTPFSASKHRDNLRETSKDKESQFLKSTNTSLQQ